MIQRYELYDNYGFEVYEYEKDNDGDWCKSEDVEKLEEWNKQLLNVLKKCKRIHYYCEDSWWSCPKSEDGCANELVGTECNCGAEEHNAMIDNIFIQITGKKPDDYDPKNFHYADNQKKNILQSNSTGGVRI